MELAFLPSPNPLLSPSPSPPLPFNLTPKCSRHGHPFRVCASSNPGPPFGLPWQCLSRSFPRGSGRLGLNFGAAVKKETGFNFGVSASNPSFISPILSGGEGSDQYDVFLSFRGSDTRKGFTDQLYHSLVNAGIVPIGMFRDENSTPIGEEFGSWILDAISRSKISIPIISENYASSKWCLRELIRIMYWKRSTSHMVLPIFYKVAPSDVRHLKGNFGEAFYSRQERFDKKDIEEGQQALKEVCDLHGWESNKIANGHEGELIKLVVKTVLSELRKHFPLDVPKELVGLDGHLKDIMTWIDSPSVNARMIGICGMGGIGKTTLAKCIYNQLSDKFVHVSFLPDIGETTRRHGIEYLQSQLISDILQSKDKVSKVDDGINTIKSRFKGKKVPILLDDIDHKDQLNALARECKWFSSGSIIIVTTRNKVVLDQSEFEVDNKYELNEIDKKQSLLLFSRHAFRIDRPPREFEEISCNIILTTGGLPLALKVIGSYLYGKSDRKVWEDMLRKLRKMPHRDVEAILKISYDVLEDEHKEIFLDIACFFIGKKSKYAIYMWEDYGFYASLGIEELKLRCLIKIDDRGYLRMHDQLRDLGRNIVHKEGPPERRSRLWLYKEASEVLMGEKGTDRIQAISLYEGRGHRHTYTNKQFKNLQSLRFLELRRMTIIGDFKELFSELRWLHWFELLGIEEQEMWTIYNEGSFLPTNLRLPKLVVLQLSNYKITEYWRGWSSILAAKQLKVLDLAYCRNLRFIPNLSAFTELEILILNGCSSLERIDPSIGKLKSLVSLDLNDCDSLMELPEEVGELEELRELSFNSTEIVKIPTSIGSLRKLEKLSAECWSLVEIPSSIGNLSSLKHLDLWLWDCQSLRELPSSIGNLSSLQRLNLEGCESLRELPSSIGNLSSLQCLNLEGCESLRELPTSIGNLSSLQSLYLGDCRSLEEIPSSIGNLSSLQCLNLRDCWSLREIPSSIWDLSSLRHLKLWNCRSLREIPSSIGDLQNLQDLDISHSAIEKLPSTIGRLKNLRRLILQFCRSLKREIPCEIGDLLSLEILEITHAPIYYLPESIWSLSSLQHLNLWRCNNLRSLPELPSGLIHLTVSCRSRRLPQLSSLIHLEELFLDECDLLECIPELPSRPLKLYVDSCHKLMPKLDGFKYLEVLSIVRCRSIERLDLSQSHHLERLQIEDCDDLVEIQGHGNLECLEKIVIRNCKSIRRLILQELRCLKILKVNFCGSLAEIQGLDKAKFLEVLDISNCESIERLPHLSSFATLKTLNTYGCYNLHGSGADNRH
ncbi:LOW QUALITY PROTEIN: disease resistance protein TAO1-like [Rhodamnia argentea]|uniref:LOW QUALITY PROTEIN: disease resistance protein TAO1-like n=1 Tax=Rhodamnia argentea TaxID=178133 RepID=A0ABM3HJ96_9MYRT|nr:LOW QUALITY PROTEIN: disease resistance protein TAO1-like [Rhodamnia argentea]